MPSISLLDVSEDECPLGDVSEPGGTQVVLLSRIWEGKIAIDHPELRDLVDAVLATVRAPDHVEPDPLTDRRRYYRRGIGPSAWLMSS